MRARHSVPAGHYLDGVPAPANERKTRLTRTEKMSQAAIRKTHHLGTYGIELPIEKGKWRSSNGKKERDATGTSLAGELSLSVSRFDERK